MGAAPQEGLGGDGPQKVSMATPALAPEAATQIDDRTQLEQFLIESFPDLVSSPECANLSAEEIAIGLLTRLIAPNDPEREEAAEQVAVPIEGMLSVLASAVRLHWKGCPPEMETELTDQEGILWTTSIDFANRAVRLYRRVGRFDSSKEGTCEVYVFPIERLKKFLI